MVHSLFASGDDWDDQLEGFEGAGRACSRSCAALQRRGSSGCWRAEALSVRRSAQRPPAVFRLYHRGSEHGAKPEKMLKLPQRVYV
jgi:hypothetical protein